MNSTEKSKLLPCPYCGGEAVFESESECGTDFDYVVCTGCRARSDGYISGMASCAVEEWNARHLTPKQQHADEMYEMLDSLIATVKLGQCQNGQLLRYAKEIESLLAKARGEQ